MTKLEPFCQSIWITTVSVIVKQVIPLLDMIKKYKRSMSNGAADIFCLILFPCFVFSYS